MTKFNKEELGKRRAILKQYAQQEIAKSEVLQIRLDEPTYLRLFELANQQNKRASTLAREWLIERIAAEGDAHDDKMGLILRKLDELACWMQQNRTRQV